MAGPPIAPSLASPSEGGEEGSFLAEDLEAVLCRVEVRVTDERLGKDRGVAIGARDLDYQHAAGIESQLGDSFQEVLLRSIGPS